MLCKWLLCDGGIVSRTIPSARSWSSTLPFENYLGSQGKEMTESNREEHHMVKEMLEVFQGMKASDPTYIEHLNRLWGPLAQHIKEEAEEEEEEEEEKDMPALEGKLQQEKGQSESMAKSFGCTQAFVSSRSHPSAGEHPPFETVMGLLTAPTDHVADLFRKFPDQAISPNPSTK